MSLVMEIFEDFWNRHLYYKGVKVNLFGIPVFWDEQKYPSRKSFDGTIYRLKKNGYVEIKRNKLTLSKLGKEYYENKRKLSQKFASPFALNTSKNLLLMFDIPESKRAERRWLVWHLKEFQYFMIQKSVWVGPRPLPKKFIEHLKSMNLNSCIKTFKLAKSYQIK